MEEKNLNPKESMAIITEMIERSKTRRFLGDGNIMLLWGYVTVAVAALVWILLAVTHHPAVNWLWFLIWIIGGIATPRMARKSRVSAGVSTYADRICNVVWSVVGFSAIALTFLGLGFFLFGGKDCWSAMLMLPLLTVAFAEIVQGAVIGEKSMLWGGGAGMLAGLFTLCCIASGVPLKACWVIPMLIFAFAVMMIVPGHILNYKSRKEQ